MKLLIGLLKLIAILIIIVTLIGLVPLGSKGLPVGCYLPIISGFYDCSQNNNPQSTNDNLLKTQEPSSITPTPTLAG